MKPGRGWAVAGLALAGSLAATKAEAACSGRPTDASGFQGYTYGNDEVRSYATAQARVHWATSGPHAPTLASTRGDAVPDTVAFAADTAEDVLTRYAQMGYRAIPRDAACASNGGDDKLDIYLVRFAGADGATVPECDGSRCSSFVLVESTFQTKGYASAQEGFRTVIAHELFHAVQNAYRPRPEPFWAEGTAQWGMKTLFSDLSDFERQLPAFFAESTRSLDAAPSGVTAGFLYGSSVWPLFLSLQHGSAIIREIFELEADGQEPLPATDSALRAKGSSLAEAFPLFAAWNAATGKLASTGGYPDAARYPGVKLGRLADGVEQITSGLAYFAYQGTLEVPQEIALESDPARIGGVVVPIEAGVAHIERAQRLPATASGDVLVVVAGTTTKKTDAKFTMRLRAPGASPPGAPSGDGSGADGSGGDGCQAAPRPTPSGHALGLGGFVALALVALRARRRP